jgi:hypothetical protein
MYSAYLKQEIKTKLGRATRRQRNDAAETRHGERHRCHAEQKTDGHTLIDGCLPDHRFHRFVFQNFRQCEPQSRGISAPEFFERPRVNDSRRI